MTHSVRHGDCREVMAAMDAASVDAIVTDPPYGLAFMGKGWDHAVPGVEFWTEALRVAKPGAHLVAFGGTRTFHRLACASEDAGWEVRDTLSWLYGSGFPKSHNGPWGGTALKPAWEPIIMARKPLTGTVAANVAAHGTGALNVDECRIDASAGRPHIVSKAEPSLNAFGNGLNGSAFAGSTTLGRWPANVLLDEGAAAQLDAEAGERKSGVPGVRRKSHDTSAMSGRLGITGQREAGYGDTGGASRFFYTAKASRKERGEGNHHPTVKPIALMRWLCRLVTPAGGTVLDPFTGSGTTGCAAALEGFGFVGIEREAEYVAIAERRIAHWQQEAA